MGNIRSLHRQRLWAFSKRYMLSSLYTFTQSPSSNSRLVKTRALKDIPKTKQKSKILLFYRRIFSVPTTKLPAVIIGASVLAWLTALVSFSRISWCRS